MICLISSNENKLNIIQKYKIILCYKNYYKSIHMKKMANLLK